MIGPCDHDTRSQANAGSQSSSTPAMSPIEIRGGIQPWYWFKVLVKDVLGGAERRRRNSSRVDQDDWIRRQAFRICSGVGLSVSLRGMPELLRCFAGRQWLRPKALGYRGLPLILARVDA